MARQESDREDLWAEAVGLSSRIELHREQDPEPILAGFRDDGRLSIYFGQDVMLQFTPEGGLRRAYRHGELYRTQGTTLARLRRDRSATETRLLRYDLSADEVQEFRVWTIELLNEFRRWLVSGRIRVLREVSTRPGRLVSDLIAAIERILAAEQFLAPAIPGKR